jgi:hypothetical protein
MGITEYGLQDVKKELQHLSALQMTELCLRLARYKKENKELLAYLLFDANNKEAFIEKIKAEVGFMFSQLPSHSYNAAKSLRKILRLITKYVKFIAAKEAEIEMLLNFCKNYIEYTDRKTTDKPLRLILTRQIQKIITLIDKLHEDVRLDFYNSYQEMVLEAEKKFPWFNKDGFLL